MDAASSVMPSPTTDDAPGAKHAPPAEPTPPDERRPAPYLLGILGLLAMLHSLLPFAVASLVQRGGIQAGQLAVVGLHLFGPLVYVPLYLRVRLRWQHWALVLAVNHGFVLLGAVPYLR